MPANAQTKNSGGETTDEGNKSFRNDSKGHGKTVAEYFGNQGAAIAALAGIIKSILEDKTTHE